MMMMMMMVVVGISLLNSLNSLLVCNSLTPAFFYVESTAVTQ